MGVFIQLNVSNKVTQEEWEKAYEEALILVDKFKLVEMGKIEKFGKKIACLVPTKERNLDGRLGWTTVGDGKYLRLAEDQSLYRKISSPKDSEEYADPLMYVLGEHGIEDFKNPYVKHLHCFFGGKTQGEPYHTALLAISCLMDDRLNGEAVCSGDITYGQCEKAIRLANQFLAKPIGTPLRCDLDRLYKRVCKLPIEKAKMLNAFEATYLGPKDRKYYDFVNTEFSDELKRCFVRESFRGNRLGTEGFSQSMQRVLSYPISITDICEEFIALQPETLLGKDKSENNPYELFIEHVLDTSIYKQKKDLRNCLDIDAGSGEIMTVEKQFANVLLLGLRNNNVDRYIPLDELKNRISAVFGQKCDVCKKIDAYIKPLLQKKDNCKSLLNDVHDKFNAAVDKASRTYDITHFEDLPFYKKGNTFYPTLLERVKYVVKFYKGVVNEPNFAEIAAECLAEKIEFMRIQDNGLYLTKEIWEKVLKDLEEHPDSFERYYPMVRVVVEGPVRDFLHAYVGNDEFYEFCQTL